MPGRLPFKLGLQRGPDGFPQERLAVHRQRLTSAETLGNLQTQYVFYTPALIYLFVRLQGREPFWDFTAEIGREIVPVSIRFERPLFSGLGEHWDNLLFGMETDDFADFRAWMGTLTFMDRDLQRVSRIRYRELSIADPLFLEKQSVLPDILPQISLTVFAIDSNHGCAWLEHSGMPWELPRLHTRGQAFERTKIFSQAVLADKSNPYREVACKQHPDQDAMLEAELYRRYKEAKEKQSGS